MTGAVAAPPSPLGHLRLAVLVAAGAVVLTSTGDVVLLAVLLGLVARDLVAGATALLVAASVVARWGTTSLAALAGGQAVLGAAITVGPTEAAASGALAAVALVLAAPPGGGALLFGAAAGLVSVGPAGVEPELLAARVGAAVALAGIARLLAPRLPRLLRLLAPVVAALAVVAGATA